MEATLDEIKKYIDSNKEVTQYIDLALKDVKPQMKEEVFRFLILSKVQPNDPLFKLMLACHYFNLITLNAPSEIEKAFELGIITLLSKLGDTLESLKSTSVKQVEAEISKSVNRLLEQQNKAKPSQKWLKRCAFGLGGLFLFGLGGGLSYHYAQMQYASTLEVENRELLAWARSKEGKMAKQIMGWNPGLVDGSCSKNVARLGIAWGEVLTSKGEVVGNRKATTGYCIVWRVPPNQRNFR